MLPVTFDIWVVAALVVLHTSPPENPPFGPVPSLVAYTTLEKLLTSFGPPAAIERPRLISLPVHAALLSVSKFTLNAVKFVIPAVLPRHNRQVTTNSSPGL